MKFKTAIILILFCNFFIYSEEGITNLQTYSLSLLNNMLNYSSESFVELGLSDIIDDNGYTIKQKEGLEFAVKSGFVTETDIISDKNILNSGKMYSVLSKVLYYIEEKSYGAEFEKNHLYFLKLDKYEPNIKNLEAIPENFKNAIVIMYARGIIDLDKDGNFDINEIPNPDKIQEALSLVIYNKTEKQQRELKRYLEIFPGIDNNYTFDPEKDNFSIIYESAGSELPVQSVLTINKNGEVKYNRSPYEYGGVINKPVSLSGKIKKKKMKELFDFIMNKNYFFLLPADMSTSIQIMDSSTEYISIEYNGKIHKIGGYHPTDNDYFSAISDMIDKMTSSITKSKK